MNEGEIVFHAVSETYPVFQLKNPENHRETIRSCIASARISMADGCTHEANCSLLGWLPIVAILPSSGVMGIFRQEKGWKCTSCRTADEQRNSGRERQESGLLMAAPFCCRGKTTAAKLFPMRPGTGKISSKCAHGSKRPLIRRGCEGGRGKCGLRIYSGLREVRVHIYEASAHLYPHHHDRKPYFLGKNRK